MWPALVFAAATHGLVAARGPPRGAARPPRAADAVIDVGATVEDVADEAYASVVPGVELALESPISPDAYLVKARCVVPGARRRRGG